MKKSERKIIDKLEEGSRLLYKAYNNRSVFAVVVKEEHLNSFFVYPKVFVMKTSSLETVWIYINQIKKIY